MRREKHQSAEEAPTGGLDRGTTAMARKYFGTDGIRGSANSFPMTSEVALQSRDGGRQAFLQRAVTATAW